MQYTGLKDKNGKEIYEGDIYHFGYKKDLRVMKWKEEISCEEEYCGYPHSQQTMNKSQHPTQTQQSNGKEVKP